MVPRPGDLITIDLAGRRVGYKVDFVNFEPYDAVAHVTLGCSPNQPLTADGQVDCSPFGASSRTTFRIAPLQ